MDLAAVAATLSGAIEAAKEIGSLTRGAKDHKLNEHVLDLQGRLIEVQRIVLGLSNENSSLVRRVGELERAAQIEGELEREENVLLWRTRNSKREGPFCGVCWGKDVKLIPMRGSVHATNKTRIWSCTICGVQVDSGRAPERRTHFSM